MIKRPKSTTLVKGNWKCTAKIKDRKGIKLKGWGQKRTNEIDTNEMTKMASAEEDKNVKNNIENRIRMKFLKLTGEKKLTVSFSCIYNI